MRTIFLGAGASKAMGLPLTGELLPLIIKAARSETLFSGDASAGEKRRQVIEMVGELVPGLRIRPEMPSIVDLLSMIDYSLAEGITVLPEGGSTKLRLARALLESALLDVLSQCRTDYLVFDRLKKLISRGDLCIITTNYDFLPDHAIQSLWLQRTSIDYGMAWREPMTGIVSQRPGEPKIRLLKLHGSVNWLGCPFCEHIYINQHTEIALLDTDSDKNHLGEALACHCGYAPLRRVIVSPSISRSAYQTQLRSIHLAALESLRLADEVYIIGYSLPVEDLMVRSLFLRSIGNQPPKGVLKVFQVSEDARPRYNMHFAKYDYFTSGFMGFIEELENSTHR